MISVAIPIYNEEKILQENASFFERLSRQAELIFVDGKSTDRSVEIALTYGKVLHCEKGRALQMNEGAKLARNGIILFLHADSFISDQTLSNIEKVMCKNNFVGGCLTQRIDNKRLIFRLIECQGNIRAKFTKEFYGDQGIFARKDEFFKLGGFPEAPIFEDVLFTRRLRRKGKTIILPDKIFVSPRRWEKRGVIKTTLMFNALTLMFNLRVPLAKIKNFYEDLR